MAEEASEVPQSIEVVDPVSAQDMELETGCPGNPIDSSAENQSNGVEKHKENDDGGLKRGREEGGDAEDEDEVLKKRKVERSTEEERLEKLEEKKEGGEEKEEGGGEDDKEPDNVGLGPKVFGSSVEMFDYFYKFLHFWSPNTNINKYEYMVLLDLLKKGHAEADKKIGEGIQAFQVRYHPMWRSRCFFLVRVDGSSDDFSFRKCINHILPLPESMMSHIAPVGVNNGKSDGKKNGGHHKGGGGGSHGGGGGRGGRGGGGRWRGRRGGK